MRHQGLAPAVQGHLGEAVPPPHEVQPRAHEEERDRLVEYKREPVVLPCPRGPLPLQGEGVGDRLCHGSGVGRHGVDGNAEPLGHILVTVCLGGSNQDVSAERQAVSVRRVCSGVEGAHETQVVVEKGQRPRDVT